MKMNVKVIEIDKPDKEKAKEKLIELSTFLSNVWITTKKKESQ